MFDDRLIKNVFPTMIDGRGIFSAFNNPIWADDYDSELLDIAFLSLFSYKHVSPFVYLFTNEDGEIVGEKLNDLAAIIYNLKGNSWLHLYEASKAEYNPIENTDAIETLTETRSGSGTDGNLRTLNTLNTTGNTTNIESSGSVSGSNSQISSGTGSRSDDVFGFDSVNPVGDKRSSDTESNNTSGTNSSDTETTSDTTSSGTSSDTGTITDAGTNSHTETITRNYRKHGNIGVMTMNQLLSGDVEFWQWSFIRNVMDDIIDLIALKVY